MAIARRAAAAALSALFLAWPTAVWAEEALEHPRPPAGNQRGPGALFDRATNLLNEGQWELAVEEYRIAIQADPGNVEAYLRLAMLYQRLRRWADAAATAEKAHRLDPKQPEVMAAWGHALLRLGKYPEAIWVLEGLVRLNAGRPLAAVYYDLAQACYAMKWYDRSADYCQKHLQSGDSPQGRALLARTYMAQGQRDRAFQELQRSVQLYEGVDDLMR